VDEYQKYFEADKALERRFQMVMVDEPSPAAKWWCGNFSLVANRLIIR
jgi:hypothetical protein